MLCKESGSVDVPKCGQGGYKCYNDDKCKNVSGFTGMKKNNAGDQLVKEAAPTGESPDDDDKAQGNRLDYAATYELAINNLDKMLGKKGMAGLTKETEKMIEQHWKVLQL